VGCLGYISAAEVDGTTQSSLPSAREGRTVIRLMAHIVVKRCVATATTRREMYDSAMTTLVAVELENVAVLAADSQITEDSMRTVSTSTPKIIHIGKYLLGIVGDARPGDILTYNWTPPVYKGADPVQWMGKKVMPSILTAFKENGYDPYEASKDKEAGFDYIVAFDGNVFHIATDLSFIKSDNGIYGIGSGGAYALGYLYDRMGRLTIGNVEQHAEKAVQIASMLDINTCPPIQLVTQRREIT
jgi:ATP-dependent protease HslVU (ClpYQ) peptidase subunit